VTQLLLHLAEGHTGSELMDGGAMLEVEPGGRPQSAILARQQDAGGGGVAWHQASAPARA
jgi:hypothetical protein